jgi:hypothetical protein
MYFFSCMPSAFSRSREIVIVIRCHAASSLFLLDITENNSLQLRAKDDISSPRLAQGERIYEMLG